MLKNNIDMSNKSWVNYILNSSNTHRIPNNKGGVYLILSVGARVANVPIGVNVLYVGKAATSIRSRFVRYVNVLSHHNKKLLSFYQSKLLEFWFVELNSNEIDLYEIFLIKEMQKYNQDFTNKVVRKFNYTEREVV